MRTIIIIAVIVMAMCVFAQDFNVTRRQPTKSTPVTLTINLKTLQAEYRGFYSAYYQVVVTNAIYDEVSGKVASNVVSTVTRWEKLGPHKVRFSMKAYKNALRNLIKNNVEN